MKTTYIIRRGIFRLIQNKSSLLFEFFFYLVIHIIKKNKIFFFEKLYRKRHRLTLVRG